MPQVHEAPDTRLAAPVSPARWYDRIDAGIGACLAAAWAVGYLTTAMIEPAPRDPAMMHAWYVVVINTALYGSLAVMALGLIARRRVGVFASVPATVAMLAAVVACPITGHHAFGLRWFGELACVVGVAAATGYALNATRR